MGRLQRKSHQFPSKTLRLDFAYDELGRTTAIQYPDNETVVRYEYSGAYLERVCEVTSSTAPDCNAQGAVFYVEDVQYDSLGRRASVDTPAGTRTYTFDPITHRLATDEFQGFDDPEIQEVPYARILEYADYDPLGNIRQIDATASTGEVDFSATYTYDRRNRLASWEKPGVPAAGGSWLVPAMPKEYFNYDNLGNLIGHGVPSTAPADNDQIFGDARPHAISQRADLGITTTYDYDDDGNLSAEVWSSGSERHYKFDALNRLICVGPVENSCNILNPAYDSQGRRIREYYTNSSGGWVQRRYAGEYFTLQPDDRGDFHIFAFGEAIAYKRKGPVTLRTATWLPGLSWVDLPMPAPVALAVLTALALGGLGILAIRLEWAPGLRDEPAFTALSLALVVVLLLPPLPAWAGGGGTTVNYRRWILGDHLGSATVVLDEHGQAERETVYAPFGALHEDVGSAGTDTTIFASHPREPTTDLHYMQARWQNPDTGAFLSVDPVVANTTDPQSYNGYSYARNNPQSYVDPTGMCASGAGYVDCLWREGRYGQLSEMGLLNNSNPSSSGSSSSGPPVDVSPYINGAGGPSISPPPGGLLKPDSPSSPLEQDQVLNPSFLGELNDSIVQDEKRARLESRLRELEKEALALARRIEALDKYGATDGNYSPKRVPGLSNAVTVITESMRQMLRDNLAEQDAIREKLGLPRQYYDEEGMPLEMPPIASR